MLHLAEDSCDLLIAHHPPDQPIQLDASGCGTLPLGCELLALHVQSDAKGRPLYALLGQASHPVPHRAYAPGLRTWRLPWAGG